MMRPSTSPLALQKTRPSTSPLALPLEEAPFPAETLTLPIHFLTPRLLGSNFRKLVGTGEEEEEEEKEVLLRL